MSPESQQQPSSGQGTFQNHLGGEKKENTRINESKIQCLIFLSLN